MGNPSTRQKLSFLQPCLSLGIILGLLLVVSVVISEDDGIFRELPRTSHRSSRKGRDLALAEPATPTSKTKLSSSEECRDYILTFMTGTTDSQDQCTATHNAFVTAGCPANWDASTGSKTDDLFPHVGYYNKECCDNMNRYYLRHCERPNRDNASTMILGIIGIVFLCSMATALLDYFQVKWIPEACAFILIGAIISGAVGIIEKHQIMKESQKNTGTRMVYDTWYFDEDFFLQVLLPPTIFQAALSIDKPSFRRHLGPILLFALLGTALSAVSIGFMTHLMTGGHMPLLESLVYGALISSVDPVATLSILLGVGTDPTGTLYALTSGESLLNDAVAIVLFDTLQGHLGDEAALDDSSTYQSMASHFVTVSMGSIVTAILLGVCSVLFFVAMRGRQTAVVEVATFLGWALVPYYVANAMEFSGIIAILTMGFIMDYFILGGGISAAATPCRVSLEDDARITLMDILGGRGVLSANCCRRIRFIAHVMASTMETIIFAYLGLFLFDDKVYSMGLDQVAIWTCVISRAVMVASLSFMVNLSTSFCGRPGSGDRDPGSGILRLDPKTQCSS
jgi:Sodium/hydrogen exchanger family